MSKYYTIEQTSNSIWIICKDSDGTEQSNVAQFYDISLARFCVAAMNETNNEKQGPYKVEKSPEGKAWFIPGFAWTFNNEEDAIGSCHQVNLAYKRGKYSKLLSNSALVSAVEDMLGGWRYIRQAHGDLYGVGWDRAQQAVESALAAIEEEQDFDDEIEEGNKPIGKCNRCGTPVYTAEGFCGVCQGY